MTDRPGKDKDVPDNVGSPHPLTGAVPESSGGIGQPPGKKQDKAYRRERTDQGIKPGDNSPAHQNKNGKLGLFNKTAIQGIERNTGGGKAPFNAEEGPAPSSLEPQKAKRSIGARYKKVNRLMIEDTEQAFCPGMPQGMVECGGKEHEYHGGGKYHTNGQRRAAGNGMRRFPYRAPDKKYQRGDAQKNAYAVQNRVSDFFAGSLYQRLFSCFHTIPDTGHALKLHIMPILYQMPCIPVPRRTLSAAQNKQPLVLVPLTLAAMLLAAACLAGCAHLPGNAPRPEVKLLFDRMEADSPDTLNFYLVMLIRNPGKKGAAVELAGSRAFVNGAELSGGYSVRSGGGYAAAASRQEIGAVYTLDMKNLSPPLEGRTPEIETKAAVELDFSFDGGGRSTVHAEAVYAFPRVREPEFSIVSIAVVQAELINTRFKVCVKIRNPNPFPVTLSSFSYELYGSGYLWAGGRKKKLFDIPGNGETEDNLFLVTNFMDTHRSLLDQVIAMRNVRYRFTGEAEIGTGVSYLPNFIAGFDLNGDSEVLH